jgi:3-oxoacyl-[acyl-carrier protein] reductase
MRFAQRRVVITGGGGGIGAATARAFAAEGAALFLTDLRPPEAIAAELRARGASVTAHGGDVADSRSVADAVGAARAALGGIDVLVTAAGIVSYGAPERIAEAEWDRVLAINLKGTWLWCQAVIGEMRRQRRGRIVTIGSLIGRNGGNARPWVDRAEQERSSNAAYGVSKAGVHALTLFLAKDLAADNVTVNAVAPGPVATPMNANLADTVKRSIPIGRMATAAEVAATILFLAGDDAGAITGEIVDINGGLLMD